MKVSDYIADFIHEQGVTHVFEVIGGMITHMIDSLCRKNKIHIISMHHEQSAAFAAEGFARITGVPGVAMATSGPGAVNLLTGVGSCFFDSIPAVFITGQVNCSEMKNGLSVRQLGFQETDIVSMAGPITKDTVSLIDAALVPAMLERGFQTAVSGRPGPVLLDIPMDIQRAEITVEKIHKALVAEPGYESELEVAELLRQLSTAERPLILAGGGLHSAQAIGLFRRFVEMTGVPAVNSLMAVDALPYTHRQRVGLIGTYGNRWANLALSEADFLLVMGSRLDIRQTGSDVDSFKGNRVIYHVDCDNSEINNRVRGCIPIVAHLRSFLARVIQSAEGHVFPDWSAWVSRIHDLKKQCPDIAELNSIPGINPNKLMHHLSKYSSQAAVYTVDVGQHQMWAGQSLELTGKQRFLTSGGMGAMGSALPLAIGAAFALPGKPVVMIAGDGGFQINIQELQTVAHHSLPVKMIIMNNRAYGMVRQFQQSYFEERYQSTVWGFSAPDFAAVARAFNIPAFTINEASEIEPALVKMWEEPLSPLLLQISIDIEANVYPKIAFGHPFTEMESFQNAQVQNRNIV